ncbi:MAG: TonB-dependent receptor [Tenuifilaceae bacterium]
MRKSFRDRSIQLRFFHKWTNKGYSVFNSIKVAVKICAIPVTYSLVASPLESFGQTDTVSISKNIDLKELVISEKKKAETYSELNRVVMLVTQQEIQQLSASSLQEILEKVINVDIRQRGSQGVQADMTFRGGSFDQILVLLNGVNITDPQTGHHNLNIPIDLNSIQRIEVLQGPGARVYGPGAFSGAINIITHPVSKDQLKVSTKVGEYGLMEGNIQGTFNVNNLSNFLSVSDRKSNGYINNTDYKISNIFLHSVLGAKPGKFNFFTGFQSKAFGANSFYTPKYPDQFEKTSTLISSIEFERKWNQNNIIVNTYLRKHWDRFELFRDAKPIWYKSHNYHLTTLLGSKAVFQRMSKLGRTQLGVEYRSEGILSNVLGDTLSNPKKVFGTDSIYYTKGSTRNIYNIFVDHTVYFNRLNISSGANYSISNIFRSEWSYGIDLSYALTNYFRVYSSINRSFRNPTFTDLYYIGPTNIGNPNLKPESAITYEFGLKSSLSFVNGYVGYFHRDGKNIIDWVKESSLDPKWQPANYTDLNTDGIEISTISNVKEFVPILNSISISYTHFWQSKQSGYFDSYYTMDYLKQNFKFGINHQIYSNLVASWGLSWQQREGTYIDFATSTSATYNPFWLTDLKLSWIDIKYSIFAEASNLFNTQYIDIANVQQPGRWLTIGFSYKLFK